MAVYPTITTGVSAVTVTTASSSLSYQQILVQIAGSVSYKVEAMYLAGTTMNQVTTNFLMNRLNQDGKLFKFNMSPDINPYTQYLPALLVDVKDDDFVFNALSSLNLTINANSFLEIMFFMDSVSYDYDLKRDVNPEPTPAPVKQVNSNDGLKVAAGIICIAAGIILIVKNAGT